MLRALSIPMFSVTGALGQSLVGLLVWLLAIGVVQPGWAPSLLLFGPLVLFPPLLELASVHSAAVRWLAFLSFVPVIASYGLAQGIVASLLTLPWLAFALIFLAYRVRDELQRSQYVFILIKGYLVVGAGWLVMARYGHRPLDFEHVIVHATAVHFHYAGFTLPILAMQTARHEPNARGQVMVGMLLLGMPLVAMGITLSQFGVRWVECAGAWFLAAACLWFAIEQCRLAFRFRHAAIRCLLLLSSVGLLVAMSLALLYATGNFLQTPWLDIPLMIRSHGPIQVFGFALPGVVAWSLAKHNGMMPLSGDGKWTG